MTALADLVSDRDRRRLLEHLAEAGELDRLMRQPGGLAEGPEPPPLHRRRMETAPVTALAVTTPGAQGGLTAPARAVPGIRPRRGERLPASGADPAGSTCKALFDLPAQTPDRQLGLTQFGDHPRLDRHVPDEGVEVDGMEGQDHVFEPLLGGTPRHVTTIAVTPEPVALHRMGHGMTAERTTS